MKLYLIRHGESEANLNQYYAGQTDAKLTAKGKEQAKAIAPILSQISFDRVYSSDLSRAWDTQKLALPAYTAETTPLLREFDVGNLSGAPFAKKDSPEWKRIYPDLDYTFFGGENSDMVYDRLSQFLASLEKDPCENVAAFVHNGLMFTMLRVVLGTKFAFGAAVSGNCAIHVFEFDGNRWRLLAWNYMTPV